MAMSPDDLRNKTFTIVKKGYERGEVHRFLGTIADELSSFNTTAQSNDEIVFANVVDEQEPGVVFFDSVPEEPSWQDDEADDVAPSIEPEPAMTPTTSSIDDFDRMGNEISLMLRQAQESAIKIRGDAEVEARTLVDQVRLDIESDRLAHEQAAAELISRTEERAAKLRDDAEAYARQVRESADSYADEQRSEADRIHEEASAAAEADRKSAEDVLASANTSAEATLANARESADAVLEAAQRDAEARAETIVAEANATLATLVDAERDSRHNLEEARSIIDSALAELGTPRTSDS